MAEIVLKALLVIWVEGESFKTAPEGLEMAAGPKAAASGGKTLYGGALDKKGSVVTYEFDVPGDIADAQIIFRYARLHWRDNMKPAPIEMVLREGGVASAATAEATAPGGVKKDLSFADTRGWGDKASDYRLLAAPLGAFKRGKHTLTLTSQAENNSVSLDGFFVADKDFKITDEELNRCCRIKVTSEGYLGLARPTLAVRQDKEKTLDIAARRFGGGELLGLTAGFYWPRNGDHQAPALRKVDILSDANAVTHCVDLSLKTNPAIELALPDGSVSWRIGAKDIEIHFPLAMCGQFLSSLDARMKVIAAFTADMEKQDSAKAARVLPDFQHIVAYLEANAKKLGGGGDANDESAFKKGLAALEGMRTPDALICNMRRALEQAEAMMKNLKGGKDALDGMAGDLRRAYRSAADNALVPYRVFIPAAYAKTVKVPFIYMLHGGGGDEDYWPDMEDGKILKMLNERGYLAVMPKWQSRGRPWGDVLRLLQLAMKEYPKADADRVYCTGISMGGFGTYNLVTDHPELFAAACCVSGTGDVAKAEKLKNVPLLIFQGGADTVVPPAGAEKVTAKMKELGYAVDYRLFPKYGHNYHAEEYLDITLGFFDRYARKK